MSRRQLPRLQLMQDVDPFILNGRKPSDAPAPWARLRALERNDDAEDALKYFRTPRHRESAALDLLRWLRRSAIAGRNFTQGETGRRGVACPGRARAQRVRCNLKQFQFSAHASRESLIEYATKLAPKKIVLRAWHPPAIESGCGLKLAADASRHRSDFCRRQGVEMELNDVERLRYCHPESRRRRGTSH